MKNINEICAYWDSMRENWRELDSVRLNCTATVSLIEPLIINGQPETILVGSLGMLQTELKEFSDLTRTVRNFIVKGWDIVISEELRKKRHNEDYQIKQVFIPFESVESIAMSSPIRPNEQIMLKTKI